MKEIEFYKMSGAGNDFILVDDRSGVFDFPDVGAAVRKLCTRGISIGADGVILIEEPGAAGVDFRWRFYNSDGSAADMCGNGARCAARFSFLLGISGKTVSFLTGAGIVKGEVLGSGHVRIAMTDPAGMRLDEKVSIGGADIAYDFVDTGVPHAVVTVTDVDGVDVDGLGRKIRNHAAFGAEGANVNFIAVAGKDTIRLRTFERGVEAETLACGTGSVAAAVTSFLKGKVKPPVTVIPTSLIGLVVDFKSDGHQIRGVSLTGEARVVYRGRFNGEALDFGV
jgi:diaminopimelate epimerase